MQKDFDNWNEEKKIIHDKRPYKLYHHREIWWCTLGVNIGSEQDGTGEYYKRPVIILKGLSRETCIVIPLTTSANIHPLRIPVGMIAGQSASAIISQIKVIDTKRLLEKIDYLSLELFEQIRKTAKDLL